VHITGENLLILAVGIVAGWLAGRVVESTGLGLVGEVVIGLAGAFIASWILPQPGIPVGSGIVSATIEAAIGAALLFGIVRLIRGRKPMGMAEILAGSAMSEETATSLWPAMPSRRNGCCRCPTMARGTRNISVRREGEFGTGIVAALAGQLNAEIVTESGPERRCLFQSLIAWREPCWIETQLWAKLPGRSLGATG
jgi:uncharacterized membrane protein YeaQ/YmgE (transglycosylase-associated protein family)